MSYITITYVMTYNIGFLAHRNSLWWLLGEVSKVKSFSFKETEAEVEEKELGDGSPIRSMYVWHRK